MRTVRQPKDTYPSFPKTVLSLTLSTHAAENVKLPYLAVDRKAACVSGRSGRYLAHLLHIVSEVEAMTRALFLMALIAGISMIAHSQESKRFWTARQHDCRGSQEPSLDLTRGEDNA